MQEYYEYRDQQQFDYEVWLEDYFRTLYESYDDPANQAGSTEAPRRIDCSGELCKRGTYIWDHAS